MELSTNKSHSEIARAIAETITEESGRFNLDFNGTGIMHLVFLPAIRMHATLLYQHVELPWFARLNDYRW